MNGRPPLVVCVLAWALAWPAHGFDDAGLYKGIPYQEAKTWHEQFLRGEPTRAERLHAMRALVSVSRFGDRGLHYGFGNFEGRYAIDPRIPGVEQSVLMQLSSSTSQAKGYRRELLYASAFNSDRRYSVPEMNRQLRRPWGDTDADISIRHRPSGLYGRVEVKDYSLGSQSTNLKDLKKQIDKMAREGRHTGQLQFWINRREILPQIRRYANIRGVVVLGNVATGRPSLEGTMSSAEALNILDREFAQTASARGILGGGQLAFGALLLITAAPSAWEDFQTVWDPSTRTTGAWLRLGEDASYVLAGTSMATFGAARLAGPYASESLQGRLHSIGRVGRVAPVVLIVAGEGFHVARYVRGDVNAREFRTKQWVLVTMLAGREIGSMIGRLAPGPPALGAFVGGAAGGFAGEEFGRRSADYYYEKKFEKLDQAFGDAVYKRYGVN